MPNKLLCVLTGLALACLATGPALASNNKAMDADIHSVELQWEHIKFDEDGSPNQFAHIDALATFPRELRPEISRPRRAVNLGRHHHQRRGRHGKYAERHGLCQESQGRARS